jgi:hypothetical protein
MHLCLTSVGLQLNCTEPYSTWSDQMLETTSLRPTGCTLIVKMLLTAGFLTAAGCAPLPRMEPPPPLKRVDQLGSSESFSGPNAAWPGDRWWRAYGDAQLGALIEEALHGSPDLDLARRGCMQRWRKYRARMPRVCLR